MTLPQTVLTSLLLALLWIWGPGCAENIKAAQTPPKPPEHSGLVTMRGKPVTLVGNPVNVGTTAPAFTAIGNDMLPVTFPNTFAGKVIILTSVPSLDTKVCSAETRHFNEAASQLGLANNDVVVVTVSMDLPFAQARWCGAEGIQNVVTLSDYQDASMGTAYGVLIKERRLLARAVWVINQQGKVVYQQLVKEIGQEPDYSAALAAARACYESVPPTAPPTLSK